MNYKRCDRCGKEIIETTGLKSAWENACETMQSIVKAINGDHMYKIRHEEGEADLCPACRKSFDEWMKAGAKSQHPDQQEEPEPDRNIETEQIVVARIPKGPESLKFGDF